MDTSNKHCAGVSSDASGNDSHAKEELTWQQQPFERKRLNMLRGPCVVCVCVYIFWQSPQPCLPLLRLCPAAWSVAGQ